MPEYIIDSGLARRKESLEFPTEEEAWNFMANELHSVEGKNRVMVLYLIHHVKVKMNAYVNPDFFSGNLKYEEPVFAGEISKDYKGQYFTVVSKVSKEE